MRVSSLLAVQHSSLLFVWLSTWFVHLCGSLADASRQSNPGEVRRTAQQLRIIPTNLTEFVWTIHRQLRKSVRNTFYILFVTTELKLVKRLCHDGQPHSAEWDGHFKLKDCSSVVVFLSGVTIPSCNVAHGLAHTWLTSCSDSDRVVTGTLAS